MNDHERDMTGLSDAEEALSRQLARLGPVMHEQERADAEIDADFAHTLRASLVSGEELAPRPTVRRYIRRRFGGARPARRGPRSLHRRLAAGIATTLTATAVMLAVLLAILSRPASPSFRVPAATTADLLFNLPSSQIVVRSLRATISLIHAKPPSPYRGRLNLVARNLPSGPSTVRAYRLARPADIVGRARRSLGIDSRARRITVDEATWVVAQDGGGRPRRPLHSLAVSLDSGELIYHDRRNFVLPHAHRALDRGEAIATARSWLARLGWPGYHMPVSSVGIAPGSPRVRQVVLGWVGVGPAAIEEATLWVTPDKSVVEAWVWPPVAQRTAMAALSISSAWTQVRTGRVPVVVRQVRRGTAANGKGDLKHVAITEILVTKGRKGVYLVPGYRFSGNTRLQGRSRRHPWLSLTPSSR